MNVLVYLPTNITLCCLSNVDLKCSVLGLEMPVIFYSQEMELKRNCFVFLGYFLQPFLLIMYPKYFIWSLNNENVSFLTVNPNS